MPLEKVVIDEQSTEQSPVMLLCSTIFNKADLRIRVCLLIPKQLWLMCQPCSLLPNATVMRKRESHAIILCHPIVTNLSLFSQVLACISQFSFILLCKTGSCFMVQWREIVWGAQWVLWADQMANLRIVEFYTAINSHLNQWEGKLLFVLWTSRVISSCNQESLVFRLVGCKKNKIMLFLWYW